MRCDLSDSPGEDISANGSFRITKVDEGESVDIEPQRRTESGRCMPDSPPCGDSAAPFRGPPVRPEARILLGRLKE